ncbi:MAG TPA: di-heme oxidoredictase family protein [Candidatus Sulfotelmatobacter sp.]|nr:di-heme oxidoredictase family protein [Candidatus Sulfotelmatobacter sp.]
MTRRKLPLLLCIAALAVACAVVGIAQTNAPAAFATPINNDQSGAVSNGFTTNAVFAADEGVFMEEEDIGDGLGPVYNARGCVDCHAQPHVGSASQVTELRVGHNDAAGNFVNPTLTINNGATSIPNRSLVNDRSICAEGSFNVPGAETVRAFRASLNVLGDGFVEAIDSNTLVNIANAQPGQSGGAIAGQVIQVPVAEANNTLRGGRFGWKNQQASLLSFSADAYVNEQGVTSRLAPTDTTSLCDTVADPEDPFGADGLEDIDHFARFMRASQVPPRDAALSATANAITGSNLFNQVGCNICHVTSITTSAAGTVINGGAFTVPAALGNKIIRPFSDFLLHNVGTGDGIVQNGGQATANKLRTVPLWGGRTRDRLMHDLQTFTRNDAILRHAGEATGVINNYRALSATQKNQLITFLQSL